MGRSFYRGTDEQLYIGSNSFTTKIVAQPTDYELVAAQASSYQTLNTSWAASYLEAKDPVTRTQAKVQAKNDAKALLIAAVASLAKIIEATPSVTNEQRLDLGLSVRTTPTPMPAPGTSYAFKVMLNGDGSLDLSWKCNNPTGSTGTMYQMWRKIDDGEFTYVGGTGSKKFTDASVPSGTAIVTYQIQAVRSTAVGPWAQFNVNFGVNGTTVTETTPVKIAA